MTETERLRMWLLNDEDLYLSLRNAAIRVAPEHALQYLQDSIEMALDFNNLTPFQLDFMPNVNNWRIVDMLQELLEVERA